VIDRLSIFYITLPSSPIARYTQNSQTISTPADGLHSICMPYPSPNRFAPVYISQPHSTILTPTDHFLTVRRRRHGPHSDLSVPPVVSICFPLLRFHTRGELSHEQVIVCCPPGTCMVSCSQWVCPSNFCQVRIADVSFLSTVAEDILAHLWLSFHPKISKIITYSDMFLSCS
jgi:hypothetical protein